MSEEHRGGDSDLFTMVFRNQGIVVVYYESIKREVKIKPISECRCDEKLKTKVSQEFSQ